MPSTFDAIYRPSVVPLLMGLFADVEDAGEVRRWKFRATPRSEPVDVAVHAGNVETAIETTDDREKRVAQRTLLITTDPDHEIWPGLASVPKTGVFQSPEGEFWAVADSETDSRSTSLWRVRVRAAAWAKLDSYAER